MNKIKTKQKLFNLLVQYNSHGYFSLAEKRHARLIYFTLQKVKELAKSARLQLLQHS